MIYYCPLIRIQRLCASHCRWRRRQEILVCHYLFRLIKKYSALKVRVECVDLSEDR